MNCRKTAKGKEKGKVEKKEAKWKEGMMKGVQERKISMKARYTKKSKRHLGRRMD